MLLDTNVWRYVVESAAQGRLLQLTRSGSRAVQIAPAVVYETLALRDTKLRATLMRLMTNSRFDRLMPESYSESLEVLSEITRIRPGWFRSEPNIDFVNRLYGDWAKKTGGFCVICARSPDGEVRFMEERAGSGIGFSLGEARASARSVRQEFIEAGHNHRLPLDKYTARWDRPVPGWRGDDVEAWRVAGFISVF